jgi:CRP-like cAMP-binding protein
MKTVTGVWRSSSSQTAYVESEGEFVPELGPGDYFGEIAVVTGARRNASRRHADTCRLLVFFNAPAFRAPLSRARAAAAKSRRRAAARVAVLVRARNFRPSLRVREPCRSG